MEFLLSGIFLILNLYNYQSRMSSAVFFVLSAAVFFLLFFVCFRKTKCFLTSCMMMFCHTWQASWINIFGGPNSELMLPWFYIVGVLILLYVIYDFKSVFTSYVDGKILVIFIFFIIISVYPLILSPSVSEGLKEFLMIIFYVGILFIAFLKGGTVIYENRKFVVSALIFAVVSSSVMIIVQAQVYKLFGVSLFKLAVGYYHENNMVSANLLMEDSSSATVMLGCGIFYMFERLKKRTWFIYSVFIVLTMIAMGYTTRRTSVISLIIVIVPYVLFHFRHTKFKILIIALSVIAVIVMIIYLSESRGIESVDNFFDNNGRFGSYERSFEIFLQNPFGVGYDNQNIVSNLLVIYPVPHNTILRWLVMGGIPFTLPMLVIIMYVVYVSLKKKLTNDFWVIFYVLFASNFIPDILNARFFIIPCMMVLLLKAPPNQNKVRKNRAWRI